MTTPTINRMINSRPARPASFLLAALAMAIAIPACSKEEPAPAPPPPPAAPVKPLVTLDGIKLHPKVQFPDTILPSTQEAADAIAALANALASGDAAAMQRLLVERDQAVLKSLVESGEWQRQADATSIVRVCTIKEEGGAVRVGLAIQDTLGAFLTAWEGTASGDAFAFSGVAVEMKTAISAAELDGSDLTPIALPTGTAESQVALAAADPPPRIVPDKNNSGGSRSGSSSPAERPFAPPPRRPR